MKTTKDNTALNRKTIKRLFSDAKPIRGGLSISALISAFSVAVSMITPIVLGEITDIINDFGVAKANGLQPTMDMNYIGKIALTLLLLYFAKAVFSTGNMILMNNIVSKFYTCATRIKMSDKLMYVPVSFIDNSKNGELVSRMTDDVSHMGNSVHTFLNMLIVGAIQLVCIAYLMMKIDVVLALVILAIVPISVFISAKMSAASERYFGSIQSISGKIYSLYEESYAGYKTVKAYNLETQQIDKSNALVEEQKKALIQGYYLGAIVRPVITFTNNIAYIMICLLGGYYAIIGKISVGNVVTIILYSKLLASPLEGIANGLSSLQRVLASAKRVYEVLDEKEMQKEDDKPHLTPLGNVIFEDVAFSYNPEKPLIENLNISVKQGQKVAIVGPTGGGKTTIVNLLMRFYEVQKGKISIGGIDIRDISRENLHELISMVLQDTWLFSGTIYENVAYGKPDATREEVEAACRLAYVDHFIRTLDKGYDTVIGEDSSNISSGQKQLLTIARAFLTKREILILDEATSNVDTRTEVLIQKAMDKLMRGTTSFVIAHRLSTIVDADQIIVVNNGHIVEIGKHEELLAKNGFYAEIYQSQYSLVKAI